MPPTSPTVSPSATENDNPSRTFSPGTYPNVTFSKARLPCTSPSATASAASRTDGRVSSSSYVDVTFGASDW